MTSETEAWNVGLPSGFAESLFDTGNYADLVIKTPTHEFQVHKAFVCSRSPALAGSIAQALLQAAGNIRTPCVVINDPDITNQYMTDEDTLRVVLRWVYGLPNPEMQLPRDPTDDQAEENFMKVLVVRHAAGLYGIADLVKYASTMITKSLEGCESTVHLTRMCVALFSRAWGYNEAVMKLADKFEEIVRDAKGFAILRPEKELLTRIDLERKMRKRGS